MTEYTGADLFVDALEAYGIDYLFGNPGTTELPIMKGLEDSDVDYVLGLHEDVAVGMAAGYAVNRLGRADEIEGSPVGVVNLHVAPGTAHGLANVYGAAMAGAPLVVTAGAHARGFRHEEPILGGDMVEMTRQFTKWSDEVLDVSALPTMLRRAVSVARSPPTGPVFLSLPMDVLLDATDADPEPLDPNVPSAGAGDPDALARAADALVEADDPVMVVGDHVSRHRAYSPTDPVGAAVDLAEAAGARVHGEILAYEVNFPLDHDQWVSFVPPDEEFASTLLNADTLLLVGCSTNTTLVPHEEPLVPEDATVVEVSDDPWEVGKHRPAIGVRGDPGLVMADLAERVRDRLPEEEREKRLSAVEAMREFTQERMRRIGQGDAPDDPRASKAELVDALRAAAGDAYVVDEGVTARFALLTRWNLGVGQLTGNKGGGLGYGLPAAVGAALAEGERSDPRPVVGYIGDGSYLYYPHALYSAARHDLDLTVVVPDNRNYRILKDNTLDMFGGEEGDHEFVGMDFAPHVDLPANAESHGAEGVLVDSGDPDDVEAAIVESVESDGPTVVDVLVHD
ncbi:acetolactate synthase [Halobacteriales archaeon QS_8_69_26]|nr:MAG: acetolactate synthase [Halobacteriales archaeon QS_8_69_26]